MLKKLLLHSSTYSIGNILVTMAGFISVPIYTRIFTVEDYGIMNLISPCLLLLAAFGKLGIQHGVVRFYSEVATGKNPVGVQTFFATIFWGMVSTGLILTIVWLILVAVSPQEWWDNKGIAGILLLTSALILIRNISSSFVNILRAQQRSAVLSLYTVVVRYSTLALTLLFLFFVTKTLYGFYAGVIVAELAAVAGLFVFLRRDIEFSLSKASWPLYRSMLAFSIPMIGFEMSGIVLNLGDRFVLDNMMGEAAVGQYSLAYNICDYVQIIVVAAISQAVSPMYIRMWEEKGAEETRRFVQQSLHFYLLLSAAVVAGLTAVSGQLFPILASEKFDAAIPIVPYVIGGMMFDGSVMVFGAGLYIHKQSKVLMGLVFIAAIINVELCMILIPLYGIDGAAMATLLSYFVFAAMALYVSRRHFPIQVPWLQAAKFGLMALAMYFIVMQIQLNNVVFTLIAKMLVGVISYGVMVLLFDHTTRENALLLWARWSARRNKTKESTMQMTTPQPTRTEHHEEELDVPLAAIPLVSVLIPAYNRADTIVETVDSVLAQRYPRIEILVVDDGSKDNTAEILQQYGDRIRYLPKPNGGLASARNYAQNAARGEYHVWLDADDLCHPDRIALQVAFMQAHPEVVLCSSDFSAFDEHQQLASSFIADYYNIVSHTLGGIKTIYPQTNHLRNTPSNWLHDKNLLDSVCSSGQVYQQLVRGNFIHPPTVMVRADIVKQVGDFDSSLRVTSDYEWLLRASRLGDCGFINAPLLRYRISASQMSGDVNNAKIRLETFRILQRVSEQDPALYQRERRLFNRRFSSCLLGAADALVDETKSQAFQHLLNSLRYRGPSLKTLKVLLKILTPKVLLRWKRAHQQH